MEALQLADDVVLLTYVTERAGRRAGPGDGSPPDAG
jgi:hypothetical protein